MSYIGHRCTRCDHPQHRHHHHGGSCSGCTCAGFSRGPSELIPTWGLNGKPVTTITPPGEDTGLPGTQACNCEPCKTHHKQLAAA